MGLVIGLGENDLLPDFLRRFQLRPVDPLALGIEKGKIHFISEAQVEQFTAPIASIRVNKFSNQIDAHGLNLRLRRLGQEPIVERAELDVNHQRQTGNQHKQIDKEPEQQPGKKWKRRFQGVSGWMSMYPAERKVLMKRGSFASSPSFLRRAEMCTSMLR